MHTCQSLLEPPLVYERQQGNTLPRELLAVQINLEILGVEINDGGFRVEHQLPPRLRDVRPGGRWEDAHELLKRVEGRAEVELDLHGAAVAEVAGKRSVVVREVPVPRDAALCGKRGGGQVVSGCQLVKGISVG